MRRFKSALFLITGMANDRYDPYLPAGYTAPVKIGQSGTEIVGRDTANFVGALIDHASTGNMEHLQRLDDMVTAGARLAERDNPRVKGLVTGMVDPDGSCTIREQVLILNGVSATFYLLGRARQNNAGKYSSEQITQPTVIKPPVTSLDQLITELLALPEFTEEDSLRYADYLRTHRCRVKELVRANNELKRSLADSDSRSEVPVLANAAYSSLDGNTRAAIDATRRMSLMKRYKLATTNNSEPVPNKKPESTACSALDLLEKTVIINGLLFKS